MKPRQYVVLTMLQDVLCIWTQSTLVKFTCFTLDVRYALARSSVLTIGDLCVANSTPPKNILWRGDQFLSPDLWLFPREFKHLYSRFQRLTELLKEINCVQRPEQASAAKPVVKSHWIILSSKIVMFIVSPYCSPLSRNLKQIISLYCGIVLL